MNDISARGNRGNRSRPNLFIRLIATGFLSGYSPVAPGTAGSIAGLIIYAVPGFETPYVIGAFICLFFFTGVYASHRMEIYSGNDPSCVVIDEVVGMWITLIFIPKTLLLASCGFFLFRALDIIKPQPASYVERYGHGTGIMLDDVVAALYSNMLLRILILLFPGLKTF